MRPLLHTLVFLCLTASSVLAISSGETDSGTISVIGETDELTFAVQTGQHIRMGIRSLADSSSVSISGELLAPGGEVVGSVATTSGGLVFH